jgi:hypothetical protein
VCVQRTAVACRATLVSNAAPLATTDATTTMDRQSGVFVDVVAVRFSLAMASSDPFVRDHCNTDSVI